MTNTLSPIALGRFKVGPTSPPFIIAEMSGNHNGSIDRALEIVDAAAKAGAHALKLQTYTADTMTLNLRSGEFLVRDPSSLWQGQTLYELYQKAATPWEWHEAIFKRCKEHGMMGFSSPFDGTAVDFLESLGAPCYKIASLENVDLPLIRKAAATRKPLIISTGLASIAELTEAVGAARAAGCRDIILLKCTTAYPAKPDSSHLQTIPDLQRRFGVPVGLSDHSQGIGVALAAVALGACVIEKHVTLRREDGGVDAAFSLEPHELASLVLESERGWQALGTVFYGPTEQEKASLPYRRSLYVTKNMKAGDAFTSDNVRAIRPGLGLPPKYLDALIGRKVTRDVTMGTPVKEEFVGPALTTEIAPGTMKEGHL